MFGPYSLMQYFKLCPFLCCNHLAEEERTCCFTLFSSLCYVSVGGLSLFLEIMWFGLQCVIVAFPGHTHLLFGLK